MSAGVSHDVRLDELVDELVAEAFDVERARGSAKWSSACLRCAGQNSPPVQRAMASSGSRTTAEPHSGIGPA